MEQNQKKIINICKKLKVKEYVSVLGSKEYLENDKKIFDKNEIQIIYFNYMIENIKLFIKIFIQNCLLLIYCLIVVTTLKRLLFKGLKFNE